VPVAGVGERCLQEVVPVPARHFPDAFRCERRLLAAHQWLADASHEGSVTEAALRFGFSHLGRFSVSYRQAIGESASQDAGCRQKRGAGLIGEGAVWITMCRSSPRRRLWGAWRASTFANWIANERSSG